MAAPAGPPPTAQTRGPDAGGHLAVGLGEQVWALPRQAQIDLQAVMQPTGRASYRREAYAVEALRDEGIERVCRNPRYIQGSPFTRAMTAICRLRTSIGRRLSRMRSKLPRPPL